MNWKYFGTAVAVICLNSFGATGLIARGGLNFSSLSGSSTSSITGINLALLADMPFNEIVHVMIGGGFENKGYSKSSPSFYYPYTNTTTVTKENYLTIPVLVSLKMPIPSLKKVPEFKAFLDGGLIPAVNLSANGFDEVFDLNLAGEVGGEMSISPKLAGILGLGYSHGLVAVGNSGERLYVIQLFVGLRFTLPESKWSKGPV